MALALTWWIYGSGRVDWVAFRERLEPLPRAPRTAGTSTAPTTPSVVQPAKTGARLTAYVLDARDHRRRGERVGGGVKRLADGGRRVQTGFVRTYALAVFLGAVAILVYVGVRS